MGLTLIKVLIATAVVVCVNPGITLLILCGGETEKCVDVPDSGCVPVSLCFLPDLDYPPLVSLNNGTFVAFSSVTQFEYKNRSASAANVCIKQEAIKDGTLEITIKDSGTTSNPVTLHANPGSQQHCLVMPEVYNSDIVLVNITVDSNQPCFQAANTSCSITATSGNGWTPQPVSYSLGHSSYNFTGFKRCLNYSSRCCILHEGYSPAVCEAGIEEFMRPLPPNILKAEIMPSAGGLHLTVTLEALDYFCSGEGKFIAEVLNDFNVTLFTSEAEDVMEENHTKLLHYRTPFTVRQGTPLTVVMTAVDDENREKFKNSTSISRSIQWSKSSDEGNGTMASPEYGLLALIPIVLLIVVVVIGVIIYKCCKCQAKEITCPSRPIEEENRDLSELLCLHTSWKGLKYMRTERKRNTARSEDDHANVERKERVQKHISQQLLGGPSTDSEENHDDGLPESKTSTTSGPC